MRNSYGVIARKLGMSRVIDAKGEMVPVTLLKVEDQKITKVLTKERDGYEAVQVGFGTQLPKRVKKPEKGALKELGFFRFIREYRPKHGGTPEIKVGDKVTVDTFAPGDEVSATGTSKGKGFQGVVKRHGFHGGPRSHGQKHSEREPGSIGSTGQQRVAPGTRMAGRMGGDTVTVRGLKVLAVDPANNLLLVSGAIPGRRGSLVEIKALNS